MKIDIKHGVIKVVSENKIEYGKLIKIIMDSDEPKEKISYRRRKRPGFNPWKNKNPTLCSICNLYFTNITKHNNSKHTNIINGVIISP